MYKHAKRLLSAVMAFVMLVGLLPTFAQAGDEEYIYQYLGENDQSYYQISMYVYQKESTPSSSNKSFTPSIYRLKNTAANDAISLVYCADSETYDEWDAHYKIVPLEKSVTTKDREDHLRAIINNSYPFITIGKMVERVEHDGIYELHEDTVPYYEMVLISAIQQAIYADTNPDVHIGSPFAGALPVKTFNDYYKLYVYDSTYEYANESAISKQYNNIKADINTVIQWLKGLPDESVPTEPEATVRAEIAASADGNVLTLSGFSDALKAAQGLNVTVKKVDGTTVLDKQEFTLDLDGTAQVELPKDAELLSGTVTVTVTGKQNYTDVVAYEAQGGSEKSQTFIGQQTLERELTAEATATIASASLKIVPADITIYMGGNDGYEAVVGTGGAIQTTNSLPTPLFYIEAPAGVVPEDLLFASTETVMVDGEQKNKQWTVKQAGKDADGKALFYINKVYETQDDVRVKYVNEETDEAILNDTFNPSTVKDLFEDYTIELYTNTQSYDQITATAVSAPQVQYKITAETGTLRVRAVEDTDNGKNPVSIVVNKAPETKLNSNTAAVFAPAGTGYTLNHTTVSVEPSGVGLLFDDIYDSDHETDSREAALIAGTDTVLGEVASGTTRYYQAKYLDLVDTKNGNAWVKTTNNQEVTVYWAYPDGTDQNTSFTLLHFANLHRDTADGASSGYTTDDIYKVTPDTVTIERTGAGIRFDVPSGGFSPFVLVWEIRSGGGTTGGGGGGSRTGKLKIFQQVTNGGPGKGVTCQGRAANSAGKALTGKYSYSGSKSGTLQSGDSVKLAHGESITISGIPSGTKYKVTEVEANRNGYVTTAENDAGTISSSATARAAFTNRMNPEDLSTEDHYGYIIGYPMDYRTGEPTRDQALWPIQPANNITRAEVATIFFRLLSDQARETYWKQTNNYSDVDIDQWFNNAISTLSNMALINGYPDGTFRPDAYITRAEFAKIAAGFFDYATSYQQGTYVDVDANAWYADYIAAAVDLGLINGYPDGTIRPDVGIIRAEACTIVNRTLGRAPDKDYLLPTSEMRVWPDNSDTSVWYYAHMQEATNSHDYDWADAGNDRIETWTAKLPDRDWEALEKEWSNANSAPGGEVMN